MFKSKKQLKLEIEALKALNSALNAENEKMKENFKSLPAGAMPGAWCEACMYGKAYGSRIFGEQAYLCMANACQRFEPKA